MFCTGFVASRQCEQVSLSASQAPEGRAVLPFVCFSITEQTLYQQRDRLCTSFQITVYESDSCWARLGTAHTPPRSDLRYKLIRTHITTLLCVCFSMFPCWLSLFRQVQIKYLHLQLQEVSRENTKKDRTVGSCGWPFFTLWKLTKQLLTDSHSVVSTSHSRMCQGVQVNSSCSGKYLQRNTCGQLIQTLYSLFLSLLT